MKITAQLSDMYSFDTIFLSIINSLTTVGTYLSSIEADTHTVWSGETKEAFIEKCKALKINVDNVTSNIDSARAALSVAIQKYIESAEENTAALEKVRDSLAIPNY